MIPRVHSNLERGLGPNMSSKLERNLYLSNGSNRIVA